MADKPYPNELMKDIAEQIAEWDLTPEQLDNFCADLFREVGAITEDWNERAWEQQQESLRENGGPDDSHYRQTIIDAGRGHLLK